MLRAVPQSVDFLILGAGWTSQFLIPELENQNVTYAATTTSGRDNTIPFRFNPDSDDTKPYEGLPSAKTVLITFPLRGVGQSDLLTRLYRSVHGDEARWIQLGSTGIFSKEKDTSGGSDGWSDEDSPYDQTDARAIAEDELMQCVGGCVLNLCGLYGGERVPSTWIPRLAKTKEDVRARRSVHFVHGVDVARAVLAVHSKFSFGKRWIVTDLRVYDWWDLICSFSALAGSGDAAKNSKEVETRLQFARWVGELMVEEGVRALPREQAQLGRKLDGRGFWNAMGLWPVHSRLA
ncbi:hypothetical protein M011DRAFT_466590 [Sporormia fimetaria CBS 119925]|uniref:NAD(P)-binding protein n=1 Tax=Sporormia fimetaria CBS 119925 TaxID=1340428 RepID=A0A6A6VHZ3_9PLEO|nr:hypothetical protein M011DRAFT_466590 [Sporormia fimetaria CBS 119925]